MAEPSDPAEARRAVERLYVTHAPFLHRVVARLVGSSEQAEDVVHEVFVVALRSARWSLADDPARWLYGVARHLAARHLRGRGRRERALDRLARAPEAPRLATAAASPEAEVERRATVLRIGKCLDELPWEQREVFVLFELEGLELAAIAALLEVSPNTVGSRLRLARERFRRRWDQLARADR